MKTGARLHLVESGVRINAWTAGEEPLFFLKQALVLAGFAVPRGGASLQVIRVIGRSVDLAWHPGAGIHALHGNLGSRVACADLTTEEGSLSPEAVRAAAGAPLFPGDERRLPLAASLPVAAAFPGADVAELTAQDEDDTRVELLEQRGGRSRIVWWRNEEVLFGWVDSAALMVPPAPAPSLSRPPRMTLGGAQPAPPLGMRCPVDVPLFASVAGMKERVGSILAGTRFDVRGRGSDDTLVKLRTRHLDLEDNATWLVQTAALAPCAVE